MAIPLRFMPHALREICYALPFGSMIQTPVDIWLGKREGAALARRCSRCSSSGRVALLAIGQLVLQRATRKVVVQGG